MKSGWYARLFFAIVAALAVAGVVSGTACTRWGHPGAVPPTLEPISAIYVSAGTGSDTSGNGSMNSPYKTLTKAVAVLNSAKMVSPSGVTIFVANGNYDRANGEIFPIVAEKSVTITGANFGTGFKTGSFVNGLGEDTIFERIVRAPPHSVYTTLEVVPPASLSLSGLYVGSTKISLPKSSALYASLDVLATVSASDTGLGSGFRTSLRNVDGVLVPGGSFTCSSCQIHGNDFGIGAFTVALPSASPNPSSTPYATGPSVTLSQSVGDSTVSAKMYDILTDGSANVTSSNEHYQSGLYAYADAFVPVLPTSLRGVLDFGGGLAGSSGGNVFIGARTSEILVTRRFETVSALDDTWNPRQQRANRFGQYDRKITFASGTTGRNVTIRHGATGSTVTVGPAPVPTPTPSVSPSTSPTSSPT